MKRILFSEVFAGASFISCSALTLLSIFLSSKFDSSFLQVLATWLTVFSGVLLCLYLTSLVSETTKIKRGIK